MLALVPKIPLFWLKRAVGFPRRLPINLTVGLTNRCNSRCRTCRITSRKSEELSPREYRAIFSSIGDAPYWITFSGGEPFLRDDIVEIVSAAYELLRPRIINIPSNGLLSTKIEAGVREIADACSGATVIVNLSLDGIGEAHDEIRGVKGGFERTLETYRRLRALGRKNLTLGMHTVISVFNVGRIPEIYRELKKHAPDSYITEIAEERVELATVGTGITPPPAEYAAAVDFIMAEMGGRDMRGISAVTWAFRRRYYQMIKRILCEQRPVIPCYAGIASCQIAPDGEVWGCCIKAESMGNLKEAGYDFRKIWFSERADRLRADIKERNCFCPLANAAYTNLLLSPRTLAGITTEVVFRHESLGHRRNRLHRESIGGPAGAGGISSDASGAQAERPGGPVPAAGRRNCGRSR